jgi:hypothetical protein
MNTGRYILATLVRAHCLWCCGQFVAGFAALSIAPITFAFNGTVREIDKSTNATFDLPFTVTVGDMLSGLLTLEPVAFGDKGVAPSLEVSLAGKTFRATGVPVVTSNNVTFARRTRRRLYRNAKWVLDHRIAASRRAAKRHGDWFSRRRRSQYRRTNRFCAVHEPVWGTHSRPGVWKYIPRRKHCSIW